MQMTPFNTPLILSGPLRMPRQMLADQEYGGHHSVHDDKTAAKLGFSGAPIEGPTHFSQFDPLLTQLWGDAWFERGCLSVHFTNMVVEGEEVRAFVELPSAESASARCWAEKSDGTKVLEASASIGPEHGETLLEKRLQRFSNAEQLVILEDLAVGMRGSADENVIMQPDQHLGALYPFTLNQKLAVITENAPYYTDATASPWGKAIIPMEMVSVLAAYTFKDADFKIKEPVIGLFADLEIRMIKGPLFVSTPYVVRREIVKLTESRRTESCWIRTRIYDDSGSELLADTLLNHAFMKASYPHYPKNA